MRKFLLPVAIVGLTIVLAFFTWYATLMPFWAVQSGRKDSGTYYSQGMGLWANYTEHVGDSTFDPGNSLWIPMQPSAVATYAAQCKDSRSFCKNAVGDLHRQYCQVLSVYCGFAMKFLQVTMSILSGTALVCVPWAFLLVFTTRRTIVDRHLMQLTIFNGLGYLMVAAVWYFAFFRVVLSTTFYKDQYSRCSENKKQRWCWHIGTSLYLLIAAAVCYPMLSVFVASYVTHKFKKFRSQLNKHLDRSTSVDLPKDHAAIDTRDETIQTGIQAKTKKSIRSHASTELRADATSTTLQPIGRVPSAVKAVNVHELEGVVLSDGEAEEEKARGDELKYGPSKEFVVQSPKRAEAKKPSPRRTSESNAAKMQKEKSIEF